MVLEVIGQLWLFIAAMVSVFALHATWVEWGYNTNITKETSWPKTKKPKLKSEPSRQSEELSDRDTLNQEATWSLGAEVLARSLSIEKNNRTKAHAAASGSKE